MKGFFSIVVRELKDRRAVFAAAGFAALIPLLVPFAPGIGWSSAADVREIVSICMALGLGWILALFLGAGMIGSDLVQGRLGFYFSRPVGGGSIWLGKFVANSLLVLATELIIIFPVVAFFDANPFVAFHSTDWWATIDLLTGGWVLFGLLVVVPLLLVLVAHAIGIMWRARSPWIALDAVFFIGLATILWICLAPLAFEAPIALLVTSGLVVLSVPAALFMAGWSQVSLGRTDLLRGHRVLSVVLWGLLSLVTTGAAGYGAWLMAVEPSDLVTVGAVRVAPEGPWIEVIGKAAGRIDLMARFLFNRETGGYLKIPTPMSWSQAVAFSPNGQRAAWLEPVDFELGQLVFADLGDERPAVRETPLTFSYGVHRVLSENGDRVAVFERGTLSIYGIENGRLILATQWKNRGYTRMSRFVSDDLFRIVSGPGPFANGAWPIEIVEINLEAGTVETTGIVEPNADLEDRGEEANWDFSTTFDPNRDRFCLSEGRDSRRLTIRNGHTGEMEMDLGLRSEGSQSRWTEDGRLLRAYVEEEQGWLEVVSVEDGASKRWPLGQAGRVALGGESKPGEVSIGLDLECEAAFEWEHVPVSINIDTGAIRHPEGVWKPVGVWWGRTSGSGLGGRLWFGEGWTLMEWDPETGTTEHLLGKRMDNR